MEERRYKRVTDAELLKHRAAEKLIRTFMTHVEMESRVDVTRTLTLVEELIPIYAEVDLARNEGRRRAAAAGFRLVEGDASAKATELTPDEDVPAIALEEREPGPRAA